MFISPTKIISLLFLTLFICISVSAQNHLREGILLYKEGKFNESVKKLKKVKKKDVDADLGFYYLGLAYEKQNKFSKALKAFKKSIKVNPKFATAKTSLAYIYLKLGKLQTSIKVAEEALKLETKDYRIYYVLGLSYYTLRKRMKSLENINKLISLNTNVADAYFMKYNLLTFVPRVKKSSNKPTKKLSVTYKERLDILKKYITLIKNEDDLRFWKKQIKGLEYLVDFYQKKESDKNNNDEDKTSLRIIEKFKPFYTNEARRKFISGLVELVVEFKSDGSIGNIVVTHSLGYGLDERAIEAARKIRFKPEVKNGEAVSVVKRIQYRFST